MAKAVTFLKEDVYVVSVRIVEKASILYFNNNKKSRFLEISMKLPKHVATCRSIHLTNTINLVVTLMISLIVVINT